MSAPDQDYGDKVFDQPYWGNIIRAFFPGAKRIEEHWVKRIVRIHVSLDEWETSRLQQEDRSRMIAAFSGLPDRTPAVNFERRVSTGEADGFPEGEKFVLVTVINVDFPARRRRLV
jgi:hypothetical protein